MQTFMRSAVVETTPSKVFERLTDLDRAHHFMPDIVKIERLDDGPLAVGSKWRETRKIKLFGFLPVKAAATIEVTEFEKNKGYTTVSADDCNWASYSFKVRSGGAGKTKVDLLGEFKCIGKYEGNERRAAQMARFCEKADGDLLQRLKAVIE